MWRHLKTVIKLCCSDTFMAHELHSDFAIQNTFMSTVVLVNEVSEVLQRHYPLSAILLTSLSIFAQLPTSRSNIFSMLACWVLIPNWFSKFCRKNGYLNSKLVLRWDSHFNMLDKAPVLAQFRRFFLKKFPKSLSEAIQLSQIGDIPCLCLPKFLALEGAKLSLGLQNLTLGCKCNLKIIQSVVPACDIQTHTSSMTDLAVDLPCLLGSFYIFFYSFKLKKNHLFFMTTDNWQVRWCRYIFFVYLTIL